MQRCGLSSQVTTLHQGLDRCAALLGGILQAEAAAGTGGAARSRQSASMGKKTLKKPQKKTGGCGANSVWTRSWFWVGNSAPSFLSRPEESSVRWSARTRQHESKTRTSVSSSSLGGEAASASETGPDLAPVPPTKASVSSHKHPSIQVPESFHTSIQVSKFLNPSTQVPDFHPSTSVLCPPVCGPVLFSLGPTTSPSAQRPVCPRSHQPSSHRV